MEILEEFNNFIQKYGLEEYNERFWELRSELLSINPYLPDSYFTWCYINGLNWEIKSLVKLDRPKELVVAMELARLHNKSIQDKDPTPTPATTTAAIDVLGEGQTIQDCADREFEVLGVLGNSEAIWIDGDVVESSTTDEIATPIEDVYQEIDGISKDLCFPIQCASLRAEGFPQPSNPAYEDSLKDLQIGSNESEVNLKPCEVRIYDDAPKELKDLVVLLIEWMEIRLANKGMVSKTEVGANVGKVFEEMPNMKLMLFGLPDELNKFSFQQLLELSTLASNWRGCAANYTLSMPIGDSMLLLPYDRGKCKPSVSFGQRFHLNMEQVFDYGRQSIRQCMIFLSCGKGKGLLMLRSNKVLVDSWIVASTGRGMGLSFDPGGIGYWESVRIAILPNSFKVGKLTLDRKLDHNLVKNGLGSLPFDRGGVACTRRGFSFVFYPGGLNGCSSIAWVLATYMCCL